jgi:hypothetical protein
MDLREKDTLALADGGTAGIGLASVSGRSGVGATARLSGVILCFFS